MGTRNSMKLYSFLYHTHDPFNLFKEVVALRDPVDILSLKQGDGVLLLHGGADISPSLYGTKPNKYGNGSVIPSKRDAAEKQAILNAIFIGMPIIGICRGAQMLCAIDGGRLVQHIDGHVGRDHRIVDKYTNRVVRSNSVHHQMMVPREGNDIIASCPIPTKGIDDEDREVIYPSVPEVVHFIQIKGIGIQGHPEWAAGSEFVSYCSEIITERIL